MTSGYTYNVANCELSTYHITNYEDSYKLRYDFIDDYDYDYFQREPHCRTTSRLGSFGGKFLVLVLANLNVTLNMFNSVCSRCQTGS